VIASIQIIHGDCREKLLELPDASVQSCVTSPPYWGLRDYGCAGQIGLEQSPQEYVGQMVNVFQEVKRVLQDDGTLWLNLGDSYIGSGKGCNPDDSPSQKQATNRGSEQFVKSKRDCARFGGGNLPQGNGLKPKDLAGIPWRVAFALQAHGWYLRSDIIWAKKNCMPESVTDRPTRGHEFIFLLSKNERYFYDAEAIKEPCSYGVNGDGTAARKARASEKQRGHSRRHAGFNDRWDKMRHEEQCTGMRNKRDVWTVATAQYRDAHFATFPPDLIKPCILAGSRAGGIILDPFGGSGTTGQVALELGRSAILIELNEKYLPLVRKRTDTTPGMSLV
jgi:DNA modification methylase